MSEYTERTTSVYKNLSEQYSKKCDFQKQYCNIYMIRLKQMEELLQKRIQKMKANYPEVKLNKLPDTDCDKCIVIGTLYKNQKLKPSILKELAEYAQLTPQPIIDHFTDDSDTLYLEDEGVRYQLTGSIEAKSLVTGITCALLGSDIGKGKFNVNQIIFAGFPDQIPRPKLTEEVYVLILSGLDFVNFHKIAPSLKMLSLWISGHLGNISLDVTKFTRVIIAGNSVRIKPKEENERQISITPITTESQDTIDAVSLLDKFLLELSMVIDVDIMPGEFDPSNNILPQQELHHCLFPNSASYNSLFRVTNPYFCSLNGVKVLGTSGQPVSDILRLSDIPNSLDILEASLKWSHIAPTAPDTLGCFPFYETDPFILKDCPHVYFAGNQKEFGTKLVKGKEGQEVRLISIPTFAENLGGVVLNLKSLDCSFISFNV